MPTVCPQCRHEFRAEVGGTGGVIGYPLGQLHEEVAFIAYHFHWQLKDDHGNGARRPAPLGGTDFRDQCGDESA